VSRDHDRRRTDDRGLRRMVPRKDLRPVVQLISDAFKDWQSWRGRSFLSALRILSYTGPFLSLAGLSSAFREFCSAVVWVEKGQVVGVVAGHPIGSDPHYWVLKNIVVSRSHRGRGIGRELTHAIIEKAVSEGAEKAIVMVRSDNRASLNLASSDGFRPLMATSDMRLTARPAVAPAVSPANGLRRQEPSDWRRVYELTHTATPSAMRAFDPVREKEFRRRFPERLGRWLLNLLNGQLEHRFVAEVSGELAATLMVEAHLWGEHRLEMTVPPRWRGHVEEMLISEGLAILARYPELPVNIKVPASHAEAINVLRRYGFSDEKNQVILGMDLGRSGNRTPEESLC
jgi:ribosomal protein S18 acetylase RimI-like enzyme